MYLYQDFLGVRPPGFEPGTCGLRVRGGAVQGVSSSALTCSYVHLLSTL